MFDYGPDAPESDVSIRKLYEQRQFSPTSVVKEIRRKKCKVICGHFPLSRYLNVFPGATVVSFVREPLQRCYSEFLHQQRHKGYRHSFEDFFQQKGQINLQSRWLDGLPEAKIVGITEFYDRSIVMINRMLNISVPVLQLNKGRNNIHSPYSAKLIGEGSVNRFYALNIRDVSLYAAILRPFRDSKESGLLAHQQRIKNIKDILLSLPLLNRLS